MVCSMVTHIPANSMCLLCSANPVTKNFLNQGILSKLTLSLVIYTVVTLRLTVLTCQALNQHKSSAI